MVEMLLLFDIFSSPFHLGTLKDYHANPLKLDITMCIVLINEMWIEELMIWYIILHPPFLFYIKPWIHYNSGMLR